MKNKIDLIGSWVTKAKKDLISVEHELSFEDPVLESICFHSQQTVEKLIKALLVYYDIDPDKTHSIGRLILKLPDVESEIKSKLNDFDSLTDYSVEIRYPDSVEELTIEDARLAYSIAKSCWDLVTSKIKLIDSNL